MSTLDVKSFVGWLAEQPPGKKLWLFLAAVGVVLGGLSLIGSPPAEQQAVLQGAVGGATNAKAADAAAPAAVAPAAVTPAAGVAQAAAPVVAGAALGGASQPPGAAGKPVKTVTIARGSEPKALSGDNTAVAPAPPSVAGGVAPQSSAATPSAPASEGSASSAAAPVSGTATRDAGTGPRVAEAPAAPTAPPANAPPAQPPPAPSIATAAPAPVPSPPQAQKAATKTMNIQDVKSPGGISAWLVEEHSVPLLALRFVFDGGSSQDPIGKEGIANFITAMMDEGAGDLDAAAFQERMEELAVRMSFEDNRDGFYGNFETLSANREPALEMLKLALNKPRFDADATERIRKQLLANLAFAAKNPQQVAGKSWAEAAFPGHPYGRSANGTPETVAAIQPADLETFRKRTFARDTLRVVAVGDIDAKQLGLILDQVFGDLPAKAELTPVPATVPKPVEKLKVIEMDVPQSVVQFGMAGVGRKDPDFIPAFVMNHILGGGGFASRLTEEVREKRGLAYSVYSYLQPSKRAAVFAGGVATRNEAVKESIDVIRAELARMATDGPTPTELANSKSYLTGSFALQFDTNSKIANQLLWMLNEDMGIDYPARRNALIEAVTLDDVKRAAARILTVDDLLVTVVGKPIGLGRT